MFGIGGNTTGVIQVSRTTTNDIGEQVRVWEDAQVLTGWLDLHSGDSRRTAYHAKVQESTHLFICDYTDLDPRVKAENARMVIDGQRYDITVIDNPMGMKTGSQLEIFLRFTGGQ